MPGEVDVILDHDGVADRPTLLQTSSAISEHDRLTPRHVRRANTVHDCADSATFVKVRSARKQQNSAAPNRDRSYCPAVAERRRGDEAGDLRYSELRSVAQHRCGIRQGAHA